MRWIVLIAAIAAQHGKNGGDPTDACRDRGNHNQSTRVFHGSAVTAGASPRQDRQGGVCFGGGIHGGIVGLEVGAEPPPAEYFVVVDLIIINRVRSVCVGEDDYGRPTYTPSEAYWVSFWDRCRCVVVSAHLPMIDRGWWAMSNVRHIAICTEGWVVESNEGVNVIARDLIFIDSPYDWEMKHRGIYMPIRKP